MFCGTGKLPIREFKDKTRYIFPRIETTICQDRVQLLALFHFDDFDEALEILEQMVFHWKCTPKTFREEKKELIEEARDFFGSYEHRKIKSQFSLLPVQKALPLGSVSSLKKLNVSDIPKIKDYWEDLLATVPKSISFIGTQSKERMQKLEKIFLKDVPQRKIIREWKVKSSHFAVKKNVAGFWYESNTAHLCTITLDAVFFWRCAQLRIPRWQYDSRIFDTVAGFFIYDEDENPEKIGKRVFDLNISKAEFDFAQKQVLHRFDEKFDIIDIFDSLEWFDDFDEYTYGPCGIKNPLHAYEYFKSLTYADFMEFVEKIK